MPKLPWNVEYTSNGDFLFTNKEPDLDPVEPVILCSVNKNYLKFGRKMSRPPLTHSLVIVNHGDFPVAFKVMCTDNFIYFVNQKYGIIPGRRLHAMPHIRLANAVHLEISRRPYDCIEQKMAAPYFNHPKKDRLFILLAPAFSHTIAPATYFHSCAAYEKLRICLEFTGVASSSDDKGLLYRKANGWCTWETKNQFNDEKLPEVDKKPAETKSKESKESKEKVTKSTKTTKTNKTNKEKKSASKKGKSAKAPKTGGSTKTKRTQDQTQEVTKKTMEKTMAAGKTMQQTGKTQDSQKNKKPIQAVMPKSGDLMINKTKGSAETVTKRTGTSKMMTAPTKGSKETIVSKTVMPNMPR